MDTNLMPAISIITITYNAADEVERTVRSVARQKFTDFEHIIVDGASRDDTIQRARNASKKTLRILSEPDNGIYDAMNKGLEMARGRYVLFLNAGDELADPDTLAAYSAGIASESDIVYGDTTIHDARGRYLRPRHHSAPERLTADSFKNGMLVCHQAFLVRREIAPKYDLQYRLSADYDWCISCLRNADPAKIYNLHRVTVHYLEEGATTRNRFRSLSERFMVMGRRYGWPTAVSRHLFFVPRAIYRRLVPNRTT